MPPNNTYTGGLQYSDELLDAHYAGVTALQTAPSALLDPIFISSSSNTQQRITHDPLNLRTSSSHRLTSTHDPSIDLEVYALITGTPYTPTPVFHEPLTPEMNYYSRNFDECATFIDSCLHQHCLKPNWYDNDFQKVMLGRVHLRAALRQMWRKEERSTGSIDVSRGYESYIGTYTWEFFVKFLRARIGKSEEEMERMWEDERREREGRVAQEQQQQEREEGNWDAPPRYRTQNGWRQRRSRRARELRREYGGRR